eukprot:9956164-Ditylum_brightwellii.AAC.2
MTQILFKEDLPQLWHKDQATLINNNKLYLYCHQRMHHTTHVSMVRLAEQSTIPQPSSILGRHCPVQPVSLPRHKREPGEPRGARSHSSERSTTVTRKLTHERYWGAVTMVDRVSSYSYLHIITNATNEQKVTAKLAYERIMREYGHNAESYHGDNSRFESEVFINSCKAAQQSYSYCGIGDITRMG